MNRVHDLYRRENPTGLKYISLYCGAGGMDLGFYKAGFDPVWSIDQNQDAINTYKNIFNHSNIHCADAAELKPNVEADLVIGGPPCQGFSIVGYRNPEDPRSRQIFNFMNVVHSVRPKVFVMENVKALATDPKWSENREQLISMAEKDGYNAEFHVLNSSDFGVPQTRVRMFFIGVKGGNRISFNHRNTTPKKTVREALSELPEYKKEGNKTLCPAKIVLAKKPVLRGSAFSGLFFNGKGRVLNVDRPSLTLPASMGGNHTPILDQRNLNTRQTNWVEGCYKRLLKGKEIKSIPTYLRRMTVEETAALQSFPKNMKFEGVVSSKFKQIGNAVPPELAFKVAEEIKKNIFRL